jgi:hypothetical protein
MHDRGVVASDGVAADFAAGWNARSISQTRTEQLRSNGTALRNRQGVPRCRPRRAFQPRQRSQIPNKKDAVFTHCEHISTIRRSVATIWNHWLPMSGLKVADARNFERYDERFGPLTGNAGFEIWVPVKE